MENHFGRLFCDSFGLLFLLLAVLPVLFAAVRPVFAVLAGGGLVLVLLLPLLDLLGVLQQDRRGVRNGHI